MIDFIRALSFLTILPIGRHLSHDDKGLARSMAFYPLAGLVIGGLSALAFCLLSSLFPKPLALWLTLGLSVLLTGGLHLDGFSDTLDGIGCRGTREKTLEVMKDSRVGAFGAMGLLFLIVAKYLALDQLTTRAAAYALVLAAVMGRASMVLVCYRSPYARAAGGLAKLFTENLGTRELVFALASALGLALLLSGLKGAVLFSGMGVFSLGYRHFFLKKLGGVTGDILGAANELNELLCLLLIVALLRLPVL
jgi:adenosylcobinamide-GDP ribazoletransferase